MMYQLVGEVQADVCENEAEQTLVCVRFGDGRHVNSCRVSWH